MAFYATEAMSQAFCLLGYFSVVSAACRANEKRIIETCFFDASVFVEKNLTVQIIAKTLFACRFND
ncbi:hypothetical protein BZG11_06525 [Salinivibrio kushneri]|nr:hypothetical protein BZG10_13250 [Salinivibrio kushneri]OOE51686.1 hypothetical protein BZG11_06525 [Salinivibrio kushneri]OOE60534.1 hypothetical protein BZG18_11290 [Salinivibrio kushneri]